MVLSVRRRIHCGMGRFCFCFLARCFLILNVFMEGCTPSTPTPTPLSASRCLLNAHCALPPFEITTAPLRLDPLQGMHPFFSGDHPHSQRGERAPRLHQVAARLEHPNTATYTAQPLHATPDLAAPADREQRAASSNAPRPVQRKNRCTGWYHLRPRGPHNNRGVARIGRKTLPGVSPRWNLPWDCEH